MSPENLSWRDGQDIVTVHAPARLHMGFVDLHGGLGRRFGSLGLALARPGLRLSASKAAQLTVSGDDARRVRHYVRVLLDALSIPGGVHIDIEQAIPAHTGLGSGTQLALAAAGAICQLFDRSLPLEALAARLGRGKRSGTGIACFQQGGFVLDAGVGRQGGIPPVLMRLPFPEQWRLLLIFDDSLQGLSGGAERAAFQAMQSMPEEISGQLCRRVLMQLLPALLEGDAKQFGMALEYIQRCIGEHFSPWQQGPWRSPHMESVFARLTALDACGVGQSSWGPSCFALFPDEEQARRARRTLRRRFSEQDNLHFLITAASNRPAEIRRSLGGADVISQSRC